MSHLMQHREESTREIIGVISERDTDISRAEKCAEWMWTKIEAATIDLESEFYGDAFGKFALPIDWKLFRCSWCSILFSKRIDERNQLSPEAREQLRQLRCGHSRSVLVEERVISRLGVPVRICLFPSELECLVEPRREALEVIAIARLRPR